MIFLMPLVFVVALVYSSVGLGGGSSYLAILYLAGVPLAEIPPLALFLNIIVSSLALFGFGKKGYLHLRLVLPLLVASVPAAFLGARWHPEEKILSLLFSLTIFSASLILLFKQEEVQPRVSLDKKSTRAVVFVLGAVLGFLAGVIGIGGGIFLGPVMLLLGLDSPRYVAGACSAFVLVNSVAGLFSHSLQGRVDFSLLAGLGLAVFVGGLMGSALGSKKFSPLLLQKIFAVILLAVSIKLGLRIVG